MHSTQSPQKSWHPLERPCAVLGGAFFYSVPILRPEQSLCCESVVPCSYLFHQLGEGQRQRERQRQRTVYVYMSLSVSIETCMTQCVCEGHREISAVCPPTMLFEVDLLLLASLTPDLQVLLSPPLTLPSGCWDYR